MRLLPGRRRQVRFNLLVLGVLLLIFIGYLLAGKFSGASFLSGGAAPALEFRLSPRDLQQLFGVGGSSWTPVKLIRSRHDRLGAQLRRFGPFEQDLEMRLTSAHYGLFKLDNRRRRLYSHFKIATGQGLPASAPIAVIVRLNGVSLGEFVMEEILTEQLRRRDGEYLIRLSADTLLFRRLRAELANGWNGTLNKYFHRSETAGYITVFCSFFSRGPVDLGELMFRYRPGDMKYHPFLTFSAVLAVDQRQLTDGAAPELPASESLQNPAAADPRRALELTRGAPYHPLVLALF